MSTRNYMNTLTHWTLRLLAAQFNFRPSLKKHLKSTDGWTNFSIGLKTETGTMEQTIVFQNGRVKVLKHIPDNTDATMRFINDDVLKGMVKTTPNEMVNLILKNKVILDGNMAYLQAFNFFVSLLLGKQHQKMLNQANQQDIKSRKEEYGINNPQFSKELLKRKNFRLKAVNMDAEVKYLDDPYLSQYSLDSFPRIKMLHEKYLSTTPEISSERPVLLTQWYRKNGFENNSDGNPWVPELRQAYAFKYLMENKKPFIRPQNLIAGTTSPEDVSVLIYPDTTGTVIWGELGSIDKRVLKPYTITEKTVRELHDIFPFWAKRTTRAWINENHDYPFCQKIDERFVASFNFKLVSISHTVPDLPRFVNDGTHAMIEEVRQQICTLDDSETDKLNTLKSMILCLEGLNSYAANLAEEAARLAEQEADPKRKEELSKLCRICRHVPANPARTLDEAVNSAWISWIGLLMENTNVSLSPGRMDQLFQPFFEKDLETFSTEQDKKQYIEHVLELIACYFLRNAEHHALVPDVSNYL
ncbi:formate acetyltransferase, partial [bacterium]|nr:formate acetyltransferase [bacterium]